MVARLERYVINTHYSYMMEEMSPDLVLPHLIERRVIPAEKALEVDKEKSRSGKVLAILMSVREDVQCLPSLCAALKSAGQPEVAATLYDSKWFLFSCIQHYVL